MGTLLIVKAVVFFFLQAWAGDIVVSDFSHPKAEEWWLKCARMLDEKLNFDGLWIVSYHQCLTRVYTSLEVKFSWETS